MADDTVTSQTASISVRADNRAFRAALLGAAPLIAIGTLRLGLRLDTGYRGSTGAGLAGLIVGVLAVLVPLAWFVGGLALRRAKATITLQDGVLSVRNHWGRLVLHTLECEVTGLHKVRLPLTSHQHRLVVTSREDAPLLLDTRLWEAEPLQRLFAVLTAPPTQAPVTDVGFLSWSDLRTRFPGARAPWRQVHQWWFAAIVTITVIAYIAFFVNLAYFL
jgi:hypothetical protein